MMFKVISYIFFLLIIIVLLLATGIFNPVEIMVVSIIAIGIFALIDAIDK